MAVMQALPGPEAHELCVHRGIRARGRIGGILAGLGFMLPGFVLMLALAWADTRLPIAGTTLAALFMGVQVAVIALIIRAAHRIGAHILVDRRLWITAMATAAAASTSLAISAAIAGIGLALLYRTGHRLAPLAVVLAGAAAGTLFLR